MHTYTARRNFGDRHINTAIQIIASKFHIQSEKISIADDAIDKTQATDLILPYGRRAAFRCRSHNIYKTHKDEITIRMTAPYGLSEYSKFQKGMVDIFIYGFDVDDCFSHWFIISIPDLLSEIKRNPKEIKHVYPPDGNHFIEIKIKQIPTSIIFQESINLQ